MAARETPANSRNRPMGGIGRELRAVLAVALFFGTLGAMFTFRVPLWEAPEESLHLGRARDLAQGRTSAVPHVRQVGVEYHPPLYYIALTAPIKFGDAAVSDQSTSLLGVPRSIVLAARYARLTSTLIGIITVIATYFLARRLSASRLFAIAVAGFTALTPAFVMTNSTINDDVAATMFGTATLVSACYLILDRRRGKLWLSATAVCLSAAVLSKITTLFLIPIAALAVMIWLSRQSRAVRLIVACGTLIAVASALLVVMIGDLGVGNRLNSVASGKSAYSPVAAWETMTHLTLDKLAPLGNRLMTTYWGIGGWQSLEPLPNLERWAILAFAIWAAVGCTIYVLKRDGWRTLPAAKRWASVTLVLGLVLVILEITLSDAGNPRLRDVGAAHSRYVLPTISTISILLVGGAWSTIPRAWRGVFTVVILASLTTLYVQPTFSQPAAYNGPLSTIQDAANLELPLGSVVNFDNGADLAGYSKLPKEVAAGQKVDVVLYWGASRNPQKDFKGSLQLVGDDGSLLAQSDEIPTLHRFPPRVWRPGDIVRDNRALNIPFSGQPGKYALNIGAYSNSKQRTPFAVSRSTLESSGNWARMAYLKIHPSPVDRAAIKIPTDVSFGSELKLVGYDITDPKQSRVTEVSLYWQSSRQLARDYSFSLQILDERGQLISQVDALAGGRYASSLWDDNEIVTDQVSLSLDGGGARKASLGLAVYYLPDLVRLPSARDGQPVPNGLVQLQQIEMGN